MDRPIQEQIKEFWERCGCLEIKQFPTTHPLTGSGEVMIDAYVWKPTGQRLGHQLGSCEFPPIDLNNLFKYAVPIACIKLFTDGQGARGAYEKLFSLWLEGFFEGCGFEDALFRAIKGIICKGG